jgi:hypothetical protein
MDSASVEPEERGGLYSGAAGGVQAGGLVWVQSEVVVTLGSLNLTRNLFLNPRSQAIKIKKKIKIKTPR